MSAVPAVPPGARLSLPAGGWATGGGVLGCTYLDLRVVEIAAEQAGLPGWVLGRGHGLECRWASVNCPQPWCVEITVRTDTLYDATNR